LETSAVDSRVAALELRNITKMFGDFVADDDVSLRVEYGEVHALVGENGAGKTTLMNVCFGILQPTSGDILVGGERVVMASPTTARHHGLGMVHQHFKLVPSLTVAENVFLGAEPETKTKSLDRKKMARELETVSERYGLKVNPTQPVKTLSAGLRQRVEILKALYFEARVLILDEPTAVLTPQETDSLFAVLRELTSGGRSVIFITHKLGEVKAVSDRFTVMRRGQLVTTDRTADYSEHDIATLMVGRAVSLARTAPAPTRRTSEPVLLRCSQLVVNNADGRAVVDDVSFDLRAGEITGIAGVEGNGQTELVEALAGLLPSVAGSLELCDVDITQASSAARRDAGLAHVPEDRLAAGVSAASSVQDNLAGGYLRSNLFNLGLVRQRFVTEWANELIERYDIRGARATTAVGNLSGGNMQKVVLARELETQPAVLLAAQPTRGVDIGATEFVHAQLRAHRDRGAAILLVSADLGELLAVSDRLLVMYRGRIVAEFAPEEELVSRIGLAMAGVPEEQDRPDDQLPQVSSDNSPSALDTTPLQATKVAAQPQGTGAAPAVAVAKRQSVRRRHQVELHGRSAAVEPGGQGDVLASRAGEVWSRVLNGLTQPVLAVVAALIIGIIIIAALGDNPIRSYHSFLFGSFNSLNNFSGMIAQVIPLLLIAVSVYVSFRAGVINIGGEGQMYLGAFVGAIVAYNLHGLPGPLNIIVAFVAGGAAGAVWALIPGLLDAYLGVDILVTTLMFNYIGQQFTAYFADGPLRDPSSGTPETKAIPADAHLPRILGLGGANVGIFVGLAALIVMGFVILRSRWGLQARFVGENRVFASYLGISVRHKVIEIMLISGFLAGIAGVVESLGTQFRFNQTFSPGYGFIGLTVALLGRLNPIGIAIASLLYGVLEAGSTIMQLNTGVPLSLVNVLEGVIIILMTATFVRLRKRGRRGPPLVVSPTDALSLSSANQAEVE
jgi:ABC-type uncharacterized transport system ATPase subunit/ABC-type uncharacterized transport system permease subunit